MVRPRRVPFVALLALALAAPSALLPRVGLAQAEPLRVVGPKDERTPVVNIGGQLRLRALDASDGEVRGVSWQSDSPEVATVDDAGVLHGAAPGFAYVTATAGARSGSAFVVVVKVGKRGGARVRGDTKSDTGANVYLASPREHAIFRAADGASADVWVGAENEPGYTEGTGTQARFRAPTGLGVDNRVGGGVYVADTDNHCVRKVDFFGNTSPAFGRPEVAGLMTADVVSLDEAAFDSPRGIATSGSVVYVADTNNHCVWAADTQAREVRLLAGEPGVPGNTEGAGRAAHFDHPAGLALNPTGTLLAVADTRNDAIRLITTANGEVTTLGKASSARGADVAKARETDRDEDALVFVGPTSVSFDGVENVYVVDEASASVVTRSPDVRQVDLAQVGSLGDPASVTVQGTQVFVVDEAAESADSAVNVVTVGAPEITSVSPGVVGLADAAVPIVLEGRNFAPESVVTVGDRVVTGARIESARRIEFLLPSGLAAPGVRTVTVATRGGLGQRGLEVRARPLSDLAPGEITTVAGGVPYVGDGGSADLARLNAPASTAVDGAGNLYITDAGNYRVRRVDASGRITTVAGTGEAGYNGDDMPATAAQLDMPYGLAVDGAGNLFIADSNNNRVRRVDTAGRITTVAGTGEGGYDGDDKPAVSAQLNYPTGLAFDGAGSLYIADNYNGRIRRVDATGRITTVAGGGDRLGDGGPATSASLSFPYGVAVDGSGNVYTVEQYGQRVRRVDASGRITTVAGTGEFGYDGDDKPATSARIGFAQGVAVDGAGNVYIADTTNARVRRVDTSGRITTVAGTNELGYDGDGKPAAAARLSNPFGVTVDGAGNLYIADTYNNRVRRVDTAGQITTAAGTGTETYHGEPATAAGLNLPSGVAVGGAGDLYIADTYNSRVERVDTAGRITTVAGSGELGYYDGDDKPATAARLTLPQSVAVDEAGNLYIADTDNHRVRRVDASGRITTVAGTGVPGYDGDDKLATSAQLYFPSGIAVDAAGNLYISDTFNRRVRRVDASGRITTVAGAGLGGYDSDDELPATSVSLYSPYGVAVDGAGNLFIADAAAGRIRRVDTAGLIKTVAGTGESGYDGDDKPATSARLNYPYGVAVDEAGNIYIADFGNHRVRRVDTAGRITTVAGVSTHGYGGDNAPATAARLNFPYGVAVDRAGNLFVADMYNSAVRAVRRPNAVGGDGAPSIRTVRFVAASGKLVVKGNEFGASGATVRVNGTDVSSYVRRQTDKKLELRGTAVELAIEPSGNVLTVTVGGRTSVAFPFDP